MRVDRHMLNWGVFFICLGAVPLAVTQGLLGRNVVAEAWRLWPLALVILGVVIILSRTPAHVVGGTLVAACFGLAFGSVVAASPSLAVCGGSGGTAVTRSGTFSKPANVDLQIRCGTADVTTAPGNGWTATVADASSTTFDTAADRLSIRTGDAGTWFSGGSGDWRVALPQAAPMNVTASIDAATGTLALGGANVPAITMSVNAGTGTLDLTNAATSSMTVSVNAGAATVRLPVASDLAGTVSVNVSSVRICAPPDLGLQIELRQTLGGDNLSAAGLTESGGVWTTAAGAPSHRAVLHVTNNLGSLTLDRTGSCG